MTPWHFSLPFLPATPSSLSLTLEGCCVSSKKPTAHGALQGALDSPRELLPDLDSRTLLGVVRWARRSQDTQKQLM